jgi:hypothetical protein
MNLSVFICNIKFFLAAISQISFTQQRKSTNFRIIPRTFLVGGLMQHFLITKRKKTSAIPSKWQFEHLFITNYVEAII